MHTSPRYAHYRSEHGGERGGKGGERRNGRGEERRRWVRKGRSDWMVVRARLKRLHMVALQVPTEETPLLRKGSWHDFIQMRTFLLSVMELVYMSLW